MGGCDKISSKKHKNLPFFKPLTKSTPHMIQWIHTHMITLNISTLDCHTPQHIHRDPNWSQSVNKLSNPYDSTVYSTNPHSFFFLIFIYFYFKPKAGPFVLLLLLYTVTTTPLHTPLSHLSFSTLFPTKVFWKIIKFLNPNHKLVQ